LSERFPGGRVVAGSFLILTTTSGLGFYGLAVYLNAFSRERGWPVASISLATTVFFIVAGFIGLLTARVIARHDVRYTIVAGGVLGAVAIAALGHVEQRWQLFAAYSLFAVAFSGAGLIPITTVVTRWYHARRSVALSIASTGLSVGGILITPVAKWLIDEQGLDDAMPVLAVIWLLGTIPFALWLVRPDPVALGWLPDGERVAPDVAPSAPEGLPYSDALRTRFFVGLTAGYVLVLGAQVGGIQQLVKLVEERTDAETATMATVVLAATSVLARLAGGRVAERVPLARLTASLAALQALALLAIAMADATAPLFASIVVFGATVGNLLMLQPLLVAERFGVLDYPRIFSRTSFITMFGTAGGPLLLGWLYDHAGGYDTSYTVAAGCSLVGAGVLVWAGPATSGGLVRSELAHSAAPRR
jgi:MFS family permease